ASGEEPVDRREARLEPEPRGNSHGSRSRNGNAELAHPLLEPPTVSSLGLGHPAQDLGASRIRLPARDQLVDRAGPDLAAPGLEQARGDVVHARRPAVAGPVNRRTSRLRAPSAIAAASTATTAPTPPTANASSVPPDDASEPATMPPSEPVPTNAKKKSPTTRPRRWLGASSCRSELLFDDQSVKQIPSARRSASTAASDRSGASSSWSAPKPAAPASATLRLARPSVAEASAPTNAPTPKKALSRPNVPGPLSSVRFASTGSSTLLFTAKKLTKATSDSTTSARRDAST